MMLPSCFFKGGGNVVKKRRVPETFLGEIPSEGNAESPRKIGNKCTAQIHVVVDFIQLRENLRYFKRRQTFYKSEEYK